MHDSDMDPDPLAQLDGWAARAQRRAVRAHRWQAIRRLRPRLRRRTPPRRWPSAVLVLALAAGLTGSALWLGRDRLPGLREVVAAPYPTATHPAGLSAVTGTTAAPTDPFVGTPAADYASGASGFVMPEPAVVGRWTAKQVSGALADVRAALVAMYVDRRAVVDHDPTAVLAIVARNNRPDIRARYEDKVYSMPAVLISPTVRLADEPPRVDGRTTVQAATDENGLPHLEIITNYVVVYPFDVPAGGAYSRTALVHYETTWQVYLGRRVAAGDRGLWLGDSTGYMFAMSCAEVDKGLLAPAQWHDRPIPIAPEDIDQYYDRDRSLQVRDGCARD